MERLLIVGDLARDADFARVCADEGYEVWCTTSQEEALAEVERFDVSLVMLCQCLGDDDGVELLQRIRGIDERVEVILISCGAESVEVPTETSRAAAVDGLAAGALDYLRQPVGLRQLRLTFQFARAARARSVSPSYRPFEAAE